MKLEPVEVQRRQELVAYLAGASAWAKTYVKELET